MMTSALVWLCTLCPQIRSGILLASWFQPTDRTYSIHTITFGPPSLDSGPSTALYAVVSISIIHFVGSGVSVTAACVHGPYHLPCHRSFTCRSYLQLFVCQISLILLIGIGARCILVFAHSDTRSFLQNHLITCRYSAVLEAAGWRLPCCLGATSSKHEGLERSSSSIRGSLRRIWWWTTQSSE